MDAVIKGTLAFISHSIRLITPIWVIISILIGILSGLVAKKKRIVVWAMTAYIVLLLAATVFLRRDYGPEHVILRPFWSYYAWITKTSPGLLYEVIANILMMIPTGFCAAYLSDEKRLLWTVLTVVGVEVLIEGLQLVTHRGLCETDDVISGLLGALIGYGIYRFAATIYRKLINPY